MDRNFLSLFSVYVPPEKRVRGIGQLFRSPACRIRSSRSDSACGSADPASASDSSGSAGFSGSADSVDSVDSAAGYGSP